VHRETQISFLDAEATLARVAIGVAVEPNVVHVWPLVLSGSEATRETCAQVLSAAELERARRFFHERDRLAFIFSHGLMRYVLSAYVGVAPAELDFAAGEFGKPRLDNGLGSTPHPVTFNLSHSHGRALLAVTEGRELGADIEQNNPGKDLLSIAANYFFGSEFEAIRDAGEAGRTEAFFRYWTAKEAVLKGHGTGLGLPLNAFHVRFDEQLETAQVQSLDESRFEAEWVVRRLRCEPGWHCAVAARTHAWQIKVITAGAEAAKPA
jgi:4'-phosphopantetheinyl transferase